MVKYSLVLAVVGFALLVLAALWLGLPAAAAGGGLIGYGYGIQHVLHVAYRNRYPRLDGDVLVIGPQTFVSRDHSVLCYAGVNYYRRDDAEDGPEPEPRPSGWQKPVAPPSPESRPHGLPRTETEETLRLRSLLHEAWIEIVRLPGTYQQQLAERLKAAALPRLDQQTRAELSLRRIEP